MAIESSSDNARARILVVDDDESMRKAMVRVLEKNGYTTTVAGDGETAVACLNKQSFDVVVSDVHMPNMTGLELLAAIRKRDLELPVILLTGAPSIEAADEAKRLGAMNYLAKPVDNPRLLTTVARAERLGRFAQAKRQTLVALGSHNPLAGDLVGLAISLDRALESMWMAYQPIISARDKTLFGHEALMRSSDAALPHPGAVLNAGERLGRLPDIGRRVRSLAPNPCDDPAVAGVLFINLHAADLMDDELFDARSPLARMASRVILEITERATLDGVTTPERRVAALREMGYRIAVDDLGAGYAGLTSFVALQPEVVKLDMSLVRDVDSSTIKQSLIGSLVKTCREMDILTVAEGVETVAERDILVQLGLDYLQGYLFARPAKPFPPFEWK